STPPGEKGLQVVRAVVRPDVRCWLQATIPGQSYPESRRPNELLPEEVLRLRSQAPRLAAPCEAWHSSTSPRRPTGPWAVVYRTRSESESREHGAHKSSYMQLQPL